VKNRDTLEIFSYRLLVYDLLVCLCCYVQLKFCHLVNPISPGSRALFLIFGRFNNAMTHVRTAFDFRRVTEHIAYIQEISFLHVSLVNYGAEGAAENAGVESAEWNMRKCKMHRRRQQEYCDRRIEQITSKTQTPPLSRPSFMPCICRLQELYRRKSIQHKSCSDICLSFD